MTSVRDPTVTQGPHRSRRLAAAGMGALAGVLTLVAQLGADAWQDLGGAPFGPPFGALVGVAGGLGLLILAGGLAAGKRRAADAAIAILFVLGLARLLLGLGFVDSGIDLAAAALLALSREAFPRGGAPRAGRITGTVGVVTGAAAYALYATLELGSAGATAVDRAVTAVGPAVQHAGSSLGAGGWAMRPVGELSLLLDVLVAVALAAAAAWLLAILRPGRGFVGHPPDEHRRAAEIVAAHGHDSLDPFALRDDKSFHFAAGGFVAYRAVRGTAVVAGDPVGPPAQAPAVLASFLRSAEERGWDVVVTGASARVVEVAGELGLRALHIGNEATVDPRSFTLEGRAIRKVRQSVVRLERQGWKVEVTPGDRLPPATGLELDALDRAWRGAGRRLHGFAMTLGRLWGAEEDGHSLYVMARDPQGRLRAFVRFACFRGGLSLDAVRRLGDEPNGTSEALIVAAIEHARELGLAEVSLNFAGFAHVMVPDGPLPPTQRLLRWVLQRMHGRFQLERLVRFNAKFGPTWRPRYLLYTSASRLPLAALRVLQAEAYVRPPRSRALRRRWLPAGTSQPAALALAPAAAADSS